MKYFATNDFNDIREEVLTALEDGFAVRVIPDCIGHNRAARIEVEAEAFFEANGAEKYEVTRIEYTEVFYQLPNRIKANY